LLQGDETAQVATDRSRAAQSRLKRVAHQTTSDDERPRAADVEREPVRIDLGRVDHSRSIEVEAPHVSKNESTADRGSRLEPNVLGGAEGKGARAHGRLDPGEDVVIRLDLEPIHVALLDGELP